MLDRSLQPSVFVMFVMLVAQWLVLCSCTLAAEPAWENASITMHLCMGVSMGLVGGIISSIFILLCVVAFLFYQQHFSTKQSNWGRLAQNCLACRQLIAAACIQPELGLDQQTCQDRKVRSSCWCRQTGTAIAPYSCLLTNNAFC